MIVATLRAMGIRHTMLVVSCFIIALSCLFDKSMSHTRLLRIFAAGLWVLNGLH